MTNNALKRKHLPKKSIYWKFTIDIHVSDKELRYAYADVIALKELYNRLENEIVDRYTDYTNKHRPEWWKL